MSQSIRGLTAEAQDVGKNRFRGNRPLQVFDFVDAIFENFVVFEFFLTSAEGAE